MRPIRLKSAKFSVIIPEEENDRFEKSLEELLTRFSITSDKKIQYVKDFTFREANSELNTGFHSFREGSIYKGICKDKPVYLIILALNCKFQRIIEFCLLINSLEELKELIRRSEFIDSSELEDICKKYIADGIILESYIAIKKDNTNPDYEYRVRELSYYGNISEDFFTKCIEARFGYF